MSTMTIVFQNVPLGQVSRAWRNMAFDLRQELFLRRTMEHGVAVYAPKRRGFWASIFGPNLSLLGTLTPDIAQALAGEIDRGADFRVWLVDVQAPFMRPNVQDMGFRVSIGMRL